MEENQTNNVQPDKTEQPESQEHQDSTAGDKQPESTDFRRLYRSTTNRMIAGICGGIGEFFNIDPTLVRILFVISVFAGGIGFIAYVIGWIIVPEGSTGSKVHVQSSSAAPLFGIIVGALLILWGMSMIFDRMWSWYYLPDWFRPLFSFQTFFAIILITAGIFFMYLMFRKNGSAHPQKPLEETGAQQTGQPFSVPIKGSTLYRSATNRKISGICGGIGEYFNIDPTIVRVLWIVIAFASGIFPGLLIYIIMALVVPERPLIKGDV